MSNHSISYRPDIDGLRALAILPVVLFHAFPGLLPGGFIGVDIFFVISGYLITNILLKDIQEGSYSIKTFYARRVRRIFPALALVLFFCLAIGWIVLTASEYEKLGKHTAGGAGFVANIIFWKEAGYFDAAGDTKPLLHLWSLGIEEQFYIVWPLLLYLFAKRRWNVLGLIIALGLASFALNIFRVGIDPTGTFYSPWTRSWELALGAVLAYQVVRPIQSATYFLEKHASKIAWLGLLLLVVGFVVINDHRPFPGYWALLPSIGAACLIAAGNQAWTNRVILSNRVFVFFGLISFPLYLWHWPLLSFGRIIYSETPPESIRWILVSLSVVLAFLTYWFLEKPIRQSTKKRSLIITLVIIMFMAEFAGLYLYKSRGAGYRHEGLFNADPQSLVMGSDRGRLLNDCGVPSEAKRLLKSCYSPANEKAKYAVWGDSKGEAIFYGLSRESKAGEQWMMLGNTVPVMSSVERFTGRNADKNQYILDALVKNKDVKAVLLAPAARSIFAVGEVYSQEDIEKSPYFNEGLDGLTRAIKALEASGKKVIFLIDHPGFPDPKSCISGGLTKNEFLNQFFFRKENPGCKRTYEDHVRINQRYRLLIGELQKNNPHLSVYDPTHLVCDITNNRCEMVKDGKFLYSYGDHYSDFGNSLVAKELLEKLPQLLKN